MKTISFVIPTIGKSEKLPDLIEKVKNFSNDAQIILIDNSKEGHSNLKFNKFGVEYFYLAEGGVSKSRNFGASKVKSDFVYFLDDDVLPDSEWKNALKEILTNPGYENSLIGGSVFVSESIKKLVPRKYSFLVGEKILGNHDRILNYNYLAGCNIIFDTQVFNKLGGFPEEYGHKEEKIILNEEIYLQEKARKMSFVIYYKNKLSVTHYWKGDERVFIDRVKNQGMYDRKLDSQLNRQRLFLRMLKYLVLIPFKFVCTYLLNQKNSSHHFDLLKYISYVRYKV